MFSLRLFSWTVRRAGVRQSVMTGFATAACLLACVAAAAQAKAAPPTVNGGAGSCSVDFRVENGNHKPIYNAEIELTYHYGFWGLHKTSLQANTDSSGEAKFEGLPRTPKKPYEFRIRYQKRRKTVTINPLDECHAKRTVTLP